MKDLLDEVENIDIVTDFSIKTDSVYNFELELKAHSRRQAECAKQFAKANKKVNELTLNQSVQVSEIVEELCKEAIKKKKPIPPSTIQELRRTIVPKDIRYRKITNSLNDAIYIKDYLYGLTFAWSARGDRLKELFWLMKKQIEDGPTIYRTHNHEKNMDSLDLDTN